MTTAADLTPHTWDAADATRARVALQCAIQGNFARMEENLRKLPPAALVDLRYALDVMHPIVGSLAGVEPMPPYPPGGRHQSVRAELPCPRCGHAGGRCSEVIVGAARGWYSECSDCPDGRCQPRRVPVPGHVEGWAIEGGRQ